MNSISLFLLSIVIAYVVGSIPFGLILSKTFCNIDPRKQGSCNVGATNVARLCGKKWGFLTLLLDLGKGLSPVLLSFYLQSFFHLSIPFMSQAVGFSSIIGHMFPVFLLFKGGKGVATTVGVYLGLAPLPFMIAATLCVLVIWRTRYVSAGSLVLVLSLPILLFFWGEVNTGILSLITGSFVVYAHRENIKRLIAGKENFWTESKSRNG